MKQLTILDWRFAIGEQLAAEFSEAAVRHRLGPRGAGRRVRVIQAGGRRI